MSTKIIHISDIHVGRSNPDVEKENFERIARKIVADYRTEKPIIIITGDIVNDGEAGQYAEARKILDLLCDAQFRVLLIPGNHDYGKNGNHAKEVKFQHFKSSFSDFFENKKVNFPYVPPVADFGGHVFIGLNSMMDVFKDGEVNAPNDGIFAGGALTIEEEREVFFANGKLGDNQIVETLKILKKYENRDKNQKVILYLHHHPFHIIRGFIDNWVHSLVDGEKFMSQISGHVNLLLFGHEHLHISFSETRWSERYRIPNILCSGKSTGGDRAKEGTITNKGKVKKTDASKKLLGSMIEITSGGEIKLTSHDFNA